MESLGSALSASLRQMFDNISRAEEGFFTKAGINLSPREFRLIQEVCRTVDSGRDNRATAIAAAQHITAGTLTASVSLLERKGYLERRRDTADRRVVRIFPTDLARSVTTRHAAFHRNMVEGMSAALREDEGPVFLDGLKKMSAFFDSAAFETIDITADPAGKEKRFTMAKIAIATDSNSGITQAESQVLGIAVLPMPFYINEELFFEDVTLTQEQFYQKLEEGADVTTTQPAPGDVMALWDKLLEDHDEVVYIPMSSGLSSSCETAVMLSQDYDGKVQVVDNQLISVTMRQSVLDAQALAAAGKSAAEIKQILEETKFDSDIYITVDTLKYLKKGGRLTPAAAAIGTVLNLKPVLRIKGDKLDSFAKTRGWKASKKAMIDAIHGAIARDFPDCTLDDFLIAAAYTGARADAEDWLAELQEVFPGKDIHMDPLSLSVSCHIGPGARAVTLYKKMNY